MGHNLFDKVCSFENIHLAYLKARKNKRYRDYVADFTLNLEGNLVFLRKDLMSGKYCHGEYKQRIISDSKKRLIKIAPFRDRVVHHAICNIIDPIFERNFINHSYACRSGKGNKRAALKFRSMIRGAERDDYCLQCDISKYFQSIRHDILLEMFKKKINDLRLINLLKKIIFSSYDQKLIYKNKTVYAGIPIGNLTSQLFANIYLNELDWYIKKTLKIKRYIRYMDDFLIISKDKKQLALYKQAIIFFLNDKLCLSLHPKKANILPLRNGVEFLGYKFFFTHCLVKKNTVKRFEKILKKQKKDIVYSQSQYAKRITSWRAFSEFADSYNLRKWLCEKYSVPGEFLV